MIVGSSGLFCGALDQLELWTNGSTREFFVWCRISTETCSVVLSWRPTMQDNWNQIQTQTQYTKCRHKTSDVMFPSMFPGWTIRTRSLPQIFGWMYHEMTQWQGNAPRPKLWLPLCSCSSTEYNEASGLKVYFHLGDKTLSDRCGVLQEAGAEQTRTTPRGWCDS